MKSLAEPDLLQVCVERLKTRLDDEQERALRAWWTTEGRSSEPLAKTLIAQPEAEWDALITQHRAHRHPWYDYLAQQSTVQEFAAFILENSPLPAFLPLVERTLQAQICDEGRAAVLRNIEDEQVPVPHAELMRRLILALKAKAGDGLRLESFSSLVDRILVFYYGFYCDPWHLVGSLYATEVMAHHRMAHMGAGLTRLGFEPEDLEFIRVHLVCDEDHAKDWSQGVIEPSLRLNPALRKPIAVGIAACLETSARYLDDLSRRAGTAHRA
jgi:hypothetical protein